MVVFPIVMLVFRGVTCFIFWKTSLNMAPLIGYCDLTDLWSRGLGSDVWRRRRPFRAIWVMLLLKPPCPCQQRHATVTVCDVCWNMRNCVKWNLKDWKGGHTGHYMGMLNHHHQNTVPFMSLSLFHWNTCFQGNDDFHLKILTCPVSQRGLKTACNSWSCMTGGCSRFGINHKFGHRQRQYFWLWKTQFKVDP